MTGGASRIDLEPLLRKEMNIRAFVRDLAVDEHEVDDAMQDAWLRFLESPPSDPAKAFSWLVSTVRNSLLFRIRTDVRRRDREGRVARPEHVDPPPDALERREICTSVKVAVMELEEPYRRTILLRYWADLGPVEIARISEGPVATVNSQLSRARKQLRERLDREHGGRRAVWIFALLYSDLGPGVGPTTTPAGISGGVEGSNTADHVLASRSRAPRGIAIGAVAVLLLAIASLVIALREERGGSGPTIADTGAGVGGVGETSTSRRDGRRAGEAGASDARSGVTADSTLPADEQTFALHVRAVAGSEHPRGLADARIDVFDREARGLIWAMPGAERPVQTLVTGPEGHARFDQLPSGRFWVRARRDGFTVGVESVILGPEGGVLPRFDMQLPVSADRGEPVLQLPLLRASPVRGVVIDAVTRAPIVGAIVTVLTGGNVPDETGSISQIAAEPWIEQRTLSDGDGRFSLDHIATDAGKGGGGSQTLIVSAPGRARSIVTRSISQIRAEPLIEVALTRGGRVVGTLTDHEGEPVHGITVVACVDARGRGEEEERQFEKDVHRAAHPDSVTHVTGWGDDPTRGFLFATTDRSGRFVFESVPPHVPFAFIASSRDHFSLLTEGAVRVGPGETEEVHVKVERARSLLIRLVDDEGAPVEPAWVWLCVDDRTLDTVPVDGRPGTFRGLVPLEAGMVVARFAQSGVMHQRHPVPEDSLRFGHVTLEVREGVSVAGRLVDSAGLAVSGWELRVADCDCSYETTESDSNGMFELSGVCREDHALKTGSPLPRALQRMPARGVDARTQYQLPPTPAFGAHVVLSLPPGIGNETAVRSDLQWSGVLRRYGHGRATGGRQIDLGVVESTREGPHLRALVEGCRPVELSLPPKVSLGAPTPELRVVLEREDWPSISGRVTDRRGNPVEGAELASWSRLGGRIFHGYATSKRDGTYAIPVPPGWKHAISASSSGMSRPTRSVSADDLRRSCDLELLEVRRVSGVITDRDGMPVSGLGVSLEALDGRPRDDFSSATSFSDERGRVTVFLPIGTVGLALLRPPPRPTEEDEASGRVHEIFDKWRTEEPLSRIEIEVLPHERPMGEQTIRIDH